MTQPKIEGVGHGKPVMPFGSDGTDWYAFLIDTLGHLQVDVISAALGSGAATETTLALIKGYVDNLETLLSGGLPAALDTGALKTKEQSPLTGFATSANQATMITALQLIDDLRAALGSVNTDDLQVDVKTSALPTDAATQTTLALVKTAVEKIDDLQNALGSVATDILRVASKSGDKIFGFESVIFDTQTNTNLSAGANALVSTAVPTGKVWKITNAWLLYTGTAPTYLQVYINHNGVAYQLTRIAGVVNPASLSWQGEAFLDQGDTVVGNVTGATATDDLALVICGVQMNEP